MARKDRFHTSFEENYFTKPLDSITEKNLLFNPAVIIPSSGPKVAITESDVDDYPGMFLTGTEQINFHAVFAPYPKAEKAEMAEYSQIVVAERDRLYCANQWLAKFSLARTHDRGPRQRPSRLTTLSTGWLRHQHLKDASWIKPAQSTDEWIINTNLFNVDFKTGINTNTYKYYIDFAAKFGIESVMMDAGWSDNNDLFKINPNIDMDAILSHAKSKGVKINMWTLGMTLAKQLEPALERFNKWGVNFIMTDFFDRDDQKSMNTIKRIAEACGQA